MATQFNSVSVQLLDNLGVTISADFFFSMADTVTLAGLNTWAAAWLPLLDAVTDSQITKATFKVDLTLAGVKGGPISTAENERTGLFTMSQATVPYSDGVDVPALAESKIVGGKINLADTAVANFVLSLFTVTSGLTPISKFRYAITGLRSALITFRKHRKAENRRSFEI